MSEGVATYKGVPLQHLSHEELLEAAKWAWKEIHDMRGWARREHEMTDLLNDTRELLRGRRR